jgi:hypothetical protein
VALVLHPRGKRPIPSELVIQSDEGSTRIHVQWKLVELWKIPAANLLAAGDIGLIPWVPLAQFNGPPEPIFRACRDRIEQDPDPKERESIMTRGYSNCWGTKKPCSRRDRRYYRRWSTI